MIVANVKIHKYVMNVKIMTNQYSTILKKNRVIVFKTKTIMFEN